MGGKPIDGALRIFQQLFRMPVSGNSWYHYALSHRSTESGILL